MPNNQYQPINEFINYLTAKLSTNTFIEISSVTFVKNEQMTENKVLLTNVSLDDLADLIAKKLSPRVVDLRKEFETPPPSSSKDILFKSLKEAADYYGVCYQSLSNELEKIDRLIIGNSIKIYKSALERAITVHGILPKRGGKK